jgi:Uma2 family endonuclease
MYQTDPPRSPRETLPTMYDLPSENPEEPGLPDEFHLLQPELLRQTFRPPNHQADQIFTASDLNLYYDGRHPQWYKRPDWFAVLGVSRLYNDSELRLSYVTWQESVYPFVVVELLSPGTEKEDLGKTPLREINQPPNKWTVYEQILRIPYYLVYDRYAQELQAFCLVKARYQPLPIDRMGVWLEEAQLGLGLWQGGYQGVERQWLRWYDKAGAWVLTPEEQAQQEAKQAQQEVKQAQQEAKQAQRQIEQAESEIARLKQLLQAAGMNPDP